MNDAIFLLIENLSQTELSECRELSERTQMIYERALLDKDAPQEAVKEFLAKSHEQLCVLCIRSVEKQADLIGWFSVGEAIADLHCRLQFDGEMPDQSSIEWRFGRAFEGLTGRDRRLAEELIDEVRTGPVEGLENRLLSAYGDFTQVLASRNPSRPGAAESRSSDTGESTFSEEIEGFSHESPSSETGESTFSEEIEGFSHNPNFSTCIVRGQEYHPKGMTQLVIHALHALRCEGIITPTWSMIIDKARRLYEGQPEKGKMLYHAELKRADKEFKRHGLWRTLVKPNRKPKGSYSLVL